MVEVPVGIDKVLDGIAAKAVDSLQDARSGRGNAGVDEQLAVSACQNGDVTARTLDDRDITAQLVNLDRHRRGGVTDRIDDVACLGERFGGLQPVTIRTDTGGDGATHAKAAS